MRQVKSLIWDAIGGLLFIVGTSVIAAECNPHSSAPKWAESIEQLKTLAIAPQGAQTSKYSFNSKSEIKLRGETFFLLLETEGSGIVSYTIHIFHCRSDCLIIATRTAYNQPLGWQLSNDKNTLLVMDQTKRLLLSVPLVAPR